jgi:hypothetical protein
VNVRVPQLLPKSLNSREHWRPKAARVKRERAAVRLVLTSRDAPALPLTVTLVRCSPWLLDDDNAVGAMKAVRDEVAAWLGIDDRDPQVTWRVEQEKCPRVGAGTVIRLEARLDCSGLPTVSAGSAE